MRGWQPPLFVGSSNQWAFTAQNCLLSMYLTRCTSSSTEKKGGIFWMAWKVKLLGSSRPRQSRGTRESTTIICLLLGKGLSKGLLHRFEAIEHPFDGNNEVTAGTVLTAVETEQGDVGLCQVEFSHGLLKRGLANETEHGKDGVEHGLLLKGSGFCDEIKKNRVTIHANDTEVSKFPLVRGYKDSPISRHPCMRDVPHGNLLTCVH